MDLDEKKRRKRDCNRRSASTSRARKKAFIEEITRQNTDMKKRAEVMAMLPDMILALQKEGKVTYITERCEHFLQYNKGELLNQSIFPNLTASCQVQLRTLLEECLGKAGRERAAQAFHQLVGTNQQGVGGYASSASASSSASPGRSWTSRSLGSVSDSSSASQQQQASGIDMTAITAQRQGQEGGSSGAAASGLCTRSTESSNNGSSHTSECADDSTSLLSASNSSSRKKAASDLRRRISLYNTCSHHEVCKLCMIRRDQSAVWCKVRSSVRYSGDSNHNIFPAEVVLTFRILQEGAVAAWPQDWYSRKKRRLPLDPSSVFASEGNSSSGTDSGLSKGSSSSGCHMSLISNEVSGSSAKGGPEDNDDMDDDSGGGGTTHPLPRAHGSRGNSSSSELEHSGLPSLRWGGPKKRPRGGSPKALHCWSDTGDEASGEEAARPANSKVTVLDAVESLMMIAESEAAGGGKRRAVKLMEAGASGSGDGAAMDHHVRQRPPAAAAASAAAHGFPAPLKGSMGQGTEAMWEAVAAWKKKSSLHRSI